MNENKPKRRVTVIMTEGEYGHLVTMARRERRSLSRHLVHAFADYYRRSRYGPHSPDGPNPVDPHAI